MTIVSALVSFTLAAGLLTITPGVDTMLVIRSRIAAGQKCAQSAAFGIVSGCLIWGLGAAFGLGALLQTAPMIFGALRIAGAVYLVVYGVSIWAGTRSAPPRVDDVSNRPQRHGSSAFTRGLLTNLLNSKVGLFYISFLPQFVPAGVPPAPFMGVLAFVHAVLGLLWLSLLAASIGTVSRAMMKARSARWLDRLIGSLFIGLGLKLAWPTT